ncbi:MAG TPA: aminopeptidase [Syntrophales bacterium]|nr:aminopeptidase [Syntrophales bacterium]HPQ43808.1 aminopeptidase [Syntrophales bacterium]
MDNRIIECIERADYLISNLMAVKPGEEVLIAIDPQTDMRIANAVAAAALKCGAEYNISMMPVRGKDKATIFPKTLESAMEACDVFIGMTAASGAAIYNNRLKELINEKRLRECSICLRDIDNFTRGGALADYEALYKDAEKLQAIWRGKKKAKITTPAGTDLIMEMNDMEPIIECGIARKPGDAMAWSDGEVSLGPVIGTTEGTLIVDGPICYYGTPAVPVELKIEGGKIVEVVGGDSKICAEIRKQIKEIVDSDNIAEIGIGLNDRSLFNGDFEEEKKARTTAHIAMGNGYYYGQPARSTVHIDMVLYNPTIYFDDELIEKNGKLVCLGEKAD